MCLSKFNYVPEQRVNATSNATHTRNAEVDIIEFPADRVSEILRGGQMEINNNEMDFNFRVENSGSRYAYLEKAKQYPLNAATQDQFFIDMDLVEKFGYTSTLSMRLGFDGNTKVSILNCIFMGKN